MADEDNEGSKRGNLLLIIGGGVGVFLLIGVGLGVGYFLFGGAPSNPSAEVEQIIERNNPQAQAPVEEEPDEEEMVDNGEGGEMPKKMPRLAPGEQVFLTTYYEFPGNLTTNLRGSRKFIQLGIAVSTQYDDTVMANVDAHQLALRSEILTAMSAFGEEAVDGVQGRTNLAIAIRDAINAKLEQLEGFGGIEGVHFSNFVIQ
ncbi:MAG: flagellar basal body-associated FliL family protein [PS1 clade bacterium]|nr:flagellar basal body-associated FliL family protein [PS1 clade bacterium]